MDCNKAAQRRVSRSRLYYEAHNAPVDSLKQLQIQQFRNLPARTHNAPQNQKSTQSAMQ